MTAPSGCRSENETADFLSPPAVVRSENDVLSSNVETVFLNTALIYSEPALLDYGIATTAGVETVVHAASDPALPSFLGNDSGIASLLDDDALPSYKKSQLLNDGAMKSSFSIGDSKQSVSTADATNARNVPKQSYSTREIREQHAEAQKKYRPDRRRRFTDPVDFEAILNIIGGCTWWQVWVYLLISFQHVPHAMFNLNVVYMMYQPDHWCQVPGVSDSSSDNTTFKWTRSDAMGVSVVFPQTENAQRDVHSFHDQCHYFNRSSERYEELRQMSLKDAVEEVKNDTVDVVRCEKWEYDTDVMRDTIVTEWSLVCGDNFKRAHAHLFYSFGFLFGCVLGGFASDRFGRKPTVIGFGILSSMFGFLLPYSSYYPVFLLVRFLGAVCNEAADLAAYVLCMEVTGMRYRAMIGSLLQAPWALGYMLLALLAYVCKSWKQIQLITAGMHAFAVLLVCVLPESPRWLIVNNRVEEAEHYIRQACRDPPVVLNMIRFNRATLPCDLEIVKHAEQRKWVKRNHRATIFTMLKSRVLCFRTINICVVWVATALVYYGLVIALSDQSAPGRVLFSGNFFINNAVAGAIELPTLVGCVYLLRFGRKNSQMFSLIGASLFIFVAIGAMYHKYHLIALVCLLLGKIFIQASFNILYIFTMELYPTVIRNSAVGINSMIARFGSGASSYIAILSDITLSIVPMIFFAVFSLFAGIFVVFLPETGDRPLPDTLQDAVTFLKSDNRYQCYGFGRDTQTNLNPTQEDGDNDLEGGENEDNESVADVGVEAKLGHKPIFVSSSRRVRARRVSASSVPYERKEKADDC